jgi:tetratricopeptide (TPR) repeat protein
MADYYQLLGVAASASAAEIRKAYAALAREKHPDRFSDPAEKLKAQSYFQELTTAFNTLVNERSRREYDEQRERPQPTTPEEIARDAFQNARAALEGGDLQQAIENLQRAVHHAPAQAEYHAELGRALARVPAAAREAVQALERATQLAPGHIGAFLDLALVFHRQGMRVRAQKALESAQRIAPRDPRVARVAATIQGGS